MRTKPSKTLLIKKMKDPIFVKEYEKAGPVMLIAVLISSARESKGVSQAELARMLGTTQSVISRIENGNQNLSVQMLAKIASVLGCRLLIDMEPFKKAA